MNTTSPQPSIVIKKKDGSTVRMTMAEFEAYKQSQQNATALSSPASTVSSSPVQETVPPSPLVPAVSSPQSVATTTPVTHVFEHTPPVSPDISSASSLPPASPKKASVPPAPAIPTPVPVQPLSVPPAALPVKKGSVPVSSLPLSRLTATEERWYPKAMTQPPHHKPIVRDVIPPTPPVATPAMPTAAAGNSSFVSQSPSASFEKYTVGPVDDIRQLTIEQLQRMAPTTEEYEAYIMQKISVLKQESYSLYIDAIQAWRMSPVWQLYQRVILAALRSGISLEQAIVDGSDMYNHITLDDMYAIAHINAKLVV